MRQSRADLLKALGPGLLWAAAAIGVSHLVQSTRAGASYGFALIGLVLLANLFKYPFFEFGPRYAAATGESLIEGYRRQGSWVLVAFVVLTFATMFSIQAAVTLVTAGLASFLFTDALSVIQWAGALLVICALFLTFGKYALLDRLIKVIIVLLTLSTLVALGAAVARGSMAAPDFEAPTLLDEAGIFFMVALMGWMPSAIDISVWSSLWTLERKKMTGHTPTLREALIDFNIGYVGTVLIALAFLALGALVMFGSGQEFSPNGTVFAQQLMSLYTDTLGDWARPFIAVAAFLTMFSTTLTCLDAFPRVLQRTTPKLLPSLKAEEGGWLYWGWLAVVGGGALLLMSVFGSKMTMMVDLATTLSFLTAPFLALMNFRAVSAPWLPEASRPGPVLRWLSYLGITFLVGFSLVFLYWRFLH